MSIENNFYDEAEAKNPKFNNSNISDYSPNIISYYYCDPNGDYNIGCSDLKIPGLPPLASYFNPGKETHQPQATQYYNNNYFALPPESYYDSRFPSYPNGYDHSLYLQNGVKSYPTSRGNQVSTYVTTSAENHYENAENCFSSRTRGKNYFPSGNSINTTSPLDTFDNLINLRLKSFKHNGSYSSKGSPEQTTCPQMKTNSVHMIEQWKKEREILQKLFPENSHPDAKNGDQIFGDEDFLASAPGESPQ